MDERNLKRLEYHKIVALLQESTTFNISRELAGELKPLKNLQLITDKLKETTEAKEILRREPDLPLGGLRDIRRLLRKALVGGVLEPSELMEVGDTLFALRRLKTFFKDKQENYPIISELTGRLTALRELEDRIRECITPGAEVADNASPELRRLRGGIRSIQASLKEKMDAIIRSADNQKYLQDAIITMRSDRYVVPVKQEYRSQFPGIIHDQSASGATLFIEPMAIVERNNELRRLMLEEKQEIVKILTQLTDSVKAYHDDISDSVQTAGEIDLIFAKGKLSHKMDGGEPKVNNNNYINFIGARHPLLGAKAVPISVHLGREFDIIVITGPNTGGKTVALKTAGLLTLMAQSGLHISAEPGSETGVFEKVCADIGDEQSIEQSLSTFSSHMINIINILGQVNSKSLVLMDELGAGTDPTEGAALAMSILDYLHSKKVKVIATTHYSELKAFAFNRQGVENASVEFDIETLRPTYKLNIGQPGHSSAFEIARRLGLEENIINVAKESLSGEDIQVTDLIRQLESNRRNAEIDRSEASQLRKEMQRLKEEYDQKLKDLSVRRSEVMEKARQEAYEYRRKARLEAEELIKEIKDAVVRGASQQNLTAAQNAKSKLKQLGNEEKDLEQDTYYGDIPRKIRKGQEVFLPKYNQQGIALADSDNTGNTPVQVGVMKITVPLSELRLNKEKSSTETGGPKVMAEKARHIGTEIDLRGMTVDEAMESVEKYLDDAYLAGLPKAYIIHGKGTGALRKAITGLLSGHRFVKSHRLGEYGEGGMGVTVVELK